MRLTADQVREAILHSDEGIRRLALDYFTESPTTDPTVTATVLDAIARFGPDDFLRGFADLPHTAESVQWAVERLATLPPQAAGDYPSHERFVLVEALLECPFDLFAPHESTVLAMPLDANERHTLGLRRAVHELSDEVVWEQLTGWSERLDGQDEPWGSVELREAEQLERTAGRRPALAGRVLERVNGLAADEFHFLDLFAVRVAGRLRSAAAVAPLVRFLAVCDDDWHEDLQPAFNRIASDECVRLFRDQWAGAEWDFRYTAAWVMGAMHTDASIAACLELAAAEPKPYSEDAMVHKLLDSAVRSLDTAAVEPTRQFLLHLPAGWNKRMMYERDLRGSLIAACTLTGERFPEYDRWRRNEIEATAASRRRMAAINEDWPTRKYEPVKPDPPPDTIVGKATAGRNDPCPCGSGKKYKKCHGK